MHLPQLNFVSKPNRPSLTPVLRQKQQQNRQWAWPTEEVIEHLSCTQKPEVMELPMVDYLAELLWRGLSESDHSPHDEVEWLAYMQSRVDALPYDQLKRLKNISWERPLHFALAKQNCHDIVRIVLEAYPEEIRVTNSIGRLPLHVACANGASLSVIKLLTGAYPDAVMELDEHGWEPWKLARRNCSDDNVVVFLQQTEETLLGEGNNIDFDNLNDEKSCFICKRTNPRILLYATAIWLSDQTIWISDQFPDHDDLICFKCAKANGYDEQGVNNKLY